MVSLKPSMFSLPKRSSSSISSGNKRAALAKPCITEAESIAAGRPDAPIAIDCASIITTSRSGLASFA